ncbi:MAG: xylulokinase [Lentisphaerae bacterium]|nr:xylulokinase [Lentisphaerota bacterium]
MTAETLLLGIDFGTGGCKVTAIGTDGKVAGEHSVEYTTEYAHPGWSEQNPADWYAAMCKALKNLAAKGVDMSAIAAVSLDGSTHNAVLLDGNMQVLRKTIMWTDQRSIQECAFLKENYGDKIFATAYQMPTPTWTLPQLRWLAGHEPEVLKKVRHILFVKDYVRYLLTGIAVTDYIEAQGTLFFDMKKMAWSAELAELAGILPQVLPELVKPTDMVGKVTCQAAKDTGLPVNTPVICGTSDSAAEDYGAGAIEPGDCIIKLATAGNVNVMTAQAHPDPGMLTYSHVIPGMWYSVAATNAAALCQRWFRDALCQAEIAEAEKLGTQAFVLMDKLAAGSPAGANGVMFHPYLQGERSPYWDAKLRASFTGLSISSTKGDFIRAIFEGVAFSLADCFRLIKNAGLPVNRIFLIGGGAKSKLWSSIVCNVFDLPVQIPTPADASFGTALIAGTGAGIFPDSASAVRQCLHLDGSLVPDPECAGFYQELFKTYTGIHDALAPVYAKR